MERRVKRITQTDEKTDEKIETKKRKWNFPSLKQTVEAGTYKEALNKTRKEQL